MKVLISNLCECAVNDIIIPQVNPQRVYLIIPNDVKKKAESTVKRLIKQSPNVEFRLVGVKEFDVVDITRDINEIIKKENMNTIYINVTEGHKPTSFAGLFAASLNKDNIEGAFYLRQDNHELMLLPLFDFELSNTKMGILRELEEGNKKVTEINKKVKVNRSLIYASIKDLIKKKYATKDWDITDSGRICLMGADNN